MSIDIKTANIEPVRVTFDHLEARLGPGKAASRYQEAVHDFQMTQNFHYRPTWDPERELFDRRRTRVQMDDFDALLDPRQYFYAPYTIQRARQQEAADANFGLVEKRGMLRQLEPAWAAKIERFIVPLRHVEWAANTNNCFISAYGYGAPFTSAALMHAMDRLGIAQYVTRLALALGDYDPGILDRGKQIWLQDPAWQPLRQLVEDMMVCRDWFELHVVQNLLLDATFFAYAYVHFDAAIAARGGVGYTLATEFMREWFAETTRWVDATIKTAAQAKPRGRAAATPLAEAVFGDDAPGVVDATARDLAGRGAKIGLRQG
jgi:phenol hydroxylase P1 protein